ncbi:MAG TPA: hypothetical protein VM286_08505 [Candidatus Thermoplasmatota archaeon]|nr:hypothetical protein [Candidatus Thermoplasmatota archaeon]
MRSLPLAVLAALLAASLAGCTGKAAGTQRTDDALQALADRDVEIQAGTGTSRASWWTRPSGPSPRPPSS